MAYIDSGYYMHPDLGNRVLVHADATTNRVIEQPRVLEADVTSWHGQMTTVICAGDGGSSGGQYRGIASESLLVLVKVSNPRGQVKETDILRGLRWVLDTHRRFNVKVVNISVGGDFVSHDPDHLLHRAVRKLVEAGVTVVIAAGNHGTQMLLPPASSPQAIIIGGYDDQNDLDRSRWQSYHSNYGFAYDGTRKPDVIAPARWIASPILPGSFVDREARWLGPLLGERLNQIVKSRLEGGYAELALPHHPNEMGDTDLYSTLQARIHSHKLIDAKHQHVDGTSVAAPIVSSVIAQMLEANPGLTPEEIRDILTATAVPLTSISPERQGAGAVNAYQAVEMAAGRVSSS